MCMCVCVNEVGGSRGSYIFDVSIFQMGFCAQGKCLLVSILENPHVYIYILKKNCGGGYVPVLVEH